MATISGDIGCMMLDKCETPNRPYVIGYNQETKKAVLFQPDCGMWTCPHCAEKRKVHWQIVALNGTNRLLENGLPMQFVTLTSRGGKGRTKERALMHFKENWPKLRKAAKYAFPQFEYILIPEQHANGILHCHLICSSDLATRFWKDEGYKRGFGYQNKAKPLDSAGYVPAYVSKYIGKDFCHVVWPPNFRRVRSSKGWPPLPENETPEEFLYRVEFDKRTALWEVYILRDLGYDIDVKVENLTS